MLARFPDHFLTVDRIPVHHGAHLAVGGAKVKPDAAAIQIAAKQFSGLA